MTVPLRPACWPRCSGLLRILGAAGLLAPGLPALAQNAADPHDHTEVVVAQIAPGEYRDRNSLEMFHGLLLREDGTFQWALSVGALDRRSSGTWQSRDGGALLTTDPAPVAPEFVRQDNNLADDAPFLFVSRPNGNGIAGIMFTLSCDDGKQISHYTQSDGWRLVPGECETPVAISLEESTQEIGPFYFQFDGEKGGLRFVLIPNDLGIQDLTGALLLPTAEGFEFALPGGILAQMVRVDSAQSAP